MPELWISGIDSDDRLPENISHKAKKWLAELQDLGNIKVGRYLRIPTTQVVTSQSFHVFSEYVYTIVLYEEDVYEDGSVSIFFITSKSKVAPLNSHSIPQLKLLGAILGLHLCQIVSKVLGGHVVRKSLFWCESINVLYWVENPSRKFKSFAAN